MTVSFMVRGSTRAECQRELDALCAALGARATLPPSDRLVDGWVARAVKTPQAPAVGEGLTVER